MAINNTRGLGEQGPGDIVVAGECRRVRAGAVKVAGGGCTLSRIEKGELVKDSSSVESRRRYYCSRVVEGSNRRGRG